MVPSAAKPRAFSYVRMSTDVQLKGDSLRRQLERSKDYAEAQGLELAETAQLIDSGISAFTGRNIKEGALGRFLKAVEEGKIEKGSFLLVESLDRISRQEVLKSLELFISLLNAGINIVTLAGAPRLYSAENVNQVELIASLSEMARAHEESRLKGERVAAAWANKRKTAQTIPMTKRCPAWLRLVPTKSNPNKKMFEVDTSRAEIVRSMFDDASKGIGSYKIARQLTKDRVKPFGKSDGWQRSTVSKILTSRAVIGEFQPHRLVDKIRRPDGVPIKDYYPKIIDEELFYRAQAGRTDRKINGAGRKGQNFSNLFSRIAKCAYCGSTMAFENKGKGRHGGRFLVCDRAKRGLTCNIARWRYDDFEKSFLAFVCELDLERLVQNEEASNARKNLKSEIDGIRGELADIDERMTRLRELCERSHAGAAFVAERLDELALRRTQVDANLKKRRENYAMLTNTPREGQGDEMKAIIERIQKGAPGETYKLRAEIADGIKNIVSMLVIAPLGGAPLTGRAVRSLTEQHASEVQFRDPSLNETIEYMKHLMDEPRSTRRYFSIMFKDGSTRAVYPDDNDPLKFEEQILNNKEGLLRVEKTGQKTTLFKKRRRDEM
jgi:DNA invertase Pin-like site-specific DNA recombinase